MPETFRDDLTRSPDREFKLEALELIWQRLILLCCLSKRVKLRALLNKNWQLWQAQHSLILPNLESGKANPTVGRIAEILALLGFRLTPTLF